MNSVLKHILFLFAFTTIARAQVFVPGEEGFCVDGKANLYISPSATLHIDGNYFNKKSQGPLWVQSNGVISLTGNLVCNDPLICTRASSLTPTCQFIFSPKTPTVSITGTGDSLVLYHTIINKPNTVVKVNAGVKLKILDTLDLQAGSFQLDGGNIYFSYPGGTPSYVNHPYLKNENHQNRIFGDSGQVIISTIIDNSFTASSPVNIANLGLTLKGPSVPSSIVTIKRGHAKQLYAGNGSVTRYFDVLTNTGLNNNDSLFINYIDSAEYINIGIDKNKLKLYVSPGGDMDYSQLDGFNLLSQHLAKGSASTFTSVGINTSNFRVTVADEGCLNPPISALPNGTINLCSGVTQMLDAGNNTSVPNTNVIWKWSTGATTQTIAVTSNTTTQQIMIVLKDARGCITKDTVYIAPTASSPLANFSQNNKCYGDTIKLLSSSSITSGSIANYNWQFGDGTNTGLTVNDTVKKLYSTSGTYSVTLTVTSNYGCVASKTKNIISIPLPTASFLHNYNCSTGLMEFTNTSTVSPVSGSITQANWNFDTGVSNIYTSYSPTVSPTYSYSAGTYNVKLLVQTGGVAGCKDSISQSITINPRNVSSFTVSNSCLGDTVNFLNNSICNTGPCNYLWDFGDGSQSIAFNPKKIFNSATVFNVELKVLNANSCPDSSSIPVIIYPKPNVSFSVNPICFGNTSNFINNSSISTGSIVSYLWDFGNTNTSTNINAAITYTNSGNFSVSLTATSDLGCVSTITQTALAYSKPIAQYNVSNVCLGQPSLFNQNSIGNSLSYLWDFGNLVTSTTSNPSYTYGTATNYSTSLIVTDLNGCSDTSTAVTTIYTIPSPALGGTISTCGTSYVLNAGSGSSYFWQPSNITTQTVVINSNGTYSVTVTDGNGCVGFDQVAVQLNSNVKPHLGNDTVSCGSLLINAGYPGSTFLWNTGASTQTLLATNPSTYIVTVTDLNNCTGKDTIVVSINTPPTLSLGADITQCKSSLPITVTPTTNASVYLWNNGSTQSSLTTNNSGSYALTVTGSNGCKSSDTINISLMPSPIVNLGLDATACGSKLLDAQNTGFNYLWSTNNNSQTISATNTGSYWIQVTNQINGCIGRDTINLIINTPITLFLGNDTATCSNNSFTLNAGNTGSLYNWSTGETSQSIITGSSGSYGVTVTKGVCSAFDVINITLLNAPVVNLGSNINYICGNGSITLNAGNMGSVVWGSNNGFSSTQNSITVNQAGNYWAIVSNGTCSSNDTVQVFQSNQNLTAYFIASTIDTVGVPVKFVDVSQPVPTTWSWDFGDGFYSNLQNPEHVFITPQAYNVSLTVSNGFCISQIVKSVSVLRLAPSIPKGNPQTLELINFTIYPNPANYFFKTTLELSGAANINFFVYEITGKLVYHKSKNESAIFDEETNLSDLNNGLYMIEVVAENSKGFVRQKGKLVIMK